MSSRWQRLASVKTTINFSTNKSNTAAALACNAHVQMGHDTGHGELLSIVTLRHL